MVPLLPEELITTENVALVFARWDSAFPERCGLFDALRDHLVANYVRPNARFPRHLWCVSWRATRTNNAAESSHATLNASVRVRGAVPLDMFLFAIEKQMDHTEREIKAGCQSHSRAIYQRRNELLAVELDDLLNGRQGVFRFLDHCASVMNVKNMRTLDAFIQHRGNEPVDVADTLWTYFNRQAVVSAAVQLHWNICRTEKPVDEILGTVRQWAFQVEPCHSDLRAID